jgi:hypothetical protein
MDMDGPGIPGFGLGTPSGSDVKADNDRLSQPQPESESKVASSGNGQGGNGATSEAGNGGPRASEQPDLDEVVPLDFDSAGPVPGFEATASDCLNHALSIARNLNHAVLSSDHLMLALTMDESARRLLNRAGDIERLREAAMRRLGKMHGRYTAGDPSQSADLADIRKVARAAAAEREQLVAISDLVNAFPRENGRLTYGVPRNTRTAVLVDTIEKGLVPRVSDAVTRIEAAVREATQGQHQTVQTLLADLNAQQVRDEQRQREFMDEVRRQVREAVDMHVAAAFRDLEDKYNAKLTELTPKAPEPVPVQPEPEPEPDIGAAPAEPTPPMARRSYWSWIIL